MMGNGRLFQRKARGEIAHADLVLRARQGGEDRQTMWVGKRFEELGVIVKVEIDELRRRTATRY